MMSGEEDVVVLGEEGLGVVGEFDDELTSHQTASVDVIMKRFVARGRRSA